jgi:hypothetical protein
VEQLPVDDWADQDLLTKDEARDRLVAEIGRTRARLARLRSAKPEAQSEIALVARRLNAMESLHNEYDAFANERDCQ